MPALFEPKLSTFVLAYLRDGTRDWVTAAEILKRVRENASGYPTLKSLHRVSDLGVEDELRDLVACGLVARKRGFGLRPSRYRLNPSFTRLQKLVGFGLDGILSAQPSTIAAAPVFGVAHPLQLDVFVIMPFDSRVSNIYVPVKTVCSGLGLKAARADDLFTANHLMTDIWSCIYAARAVIADCTSRNPNVFYEIGVAHAIGKPAILVTRDDKDIPSDLKHVRYIVYGDGPDDAAAFSGRLEKAVRETLKIAD